MKNTIKHAVPILATLHAINKKYSKLYCFPSQIKIMQLMSQFQGIGIEIATLNRWLRDIEDKGYILRVRRIKRDKHRGMIFKSTLYKITIRGYHTLKAAGVNVWKELKIITKAGFQVAGNGLRKAKGLTSLGDILGATTLFGVKQKRAVT